MKTLPNILYEDGKLWLVEVPERPKELIDARTKPDHILIKIEDAYKFALSEAIKNKMEIVNWEEHFTKLSFKTIEPIGRNYVIKEGEFYEWKGIWVKKRQFRPIGSIQYFDFTGLHTHSEGYEFRYVIELSLPEQGHEENELMNPEPVQTEEEMQSEQLAFDFVNALDLIDRMYWHMRYNPPDKTKMAYNEWQYCIELAEYFRTEKRRCPDNETVEDGGGCFVAGAVTPNSQPVLHDDQERKDFCIWYYAQSQPLDANRVFDYFTRKSL